MAKMNLVAVVIRDLNITFEIEDETVMPGYTQYEVHLLPKEIRKQIEEFEIKVISDLHESSATVFEGDETWFKDIRENLKENRNQGEGIPNVLMPSKIYDEFQIRFNEYSKEYSDIKESIISGYDEFVKEFMKGISESFPNATNVLKSIPSKEDYEKSRQMTLHKKEIGAIE